MEIHELNANQDHIGHLKMIYEDWQEEEPAPKEDTEIKLTYISSYTSMKSPPWGVCNSINASKVNTYRKQRRCLLQSWPICTAKEVIVCSFTATLGHFVQQWCQIV